MITHDETKILIVDSQPLVRFGLKSILLSKMANAIVLEAATGAEAFDMLKDNPDINLVIADGMQDDGADTGLVRIHGSNFPKVGLILLAECRDPDWLLCAYDLGARGVISKNCSYNTLLSAIQLVLAGGVYIPAEVLDLLRFKSNAPVHDMQIDESLKSDSKNVLAVLTPRQREVFGLLIKGRSNKEICRILGLSSGTVKNYVAAILRSLDVKNRTQAVSFCFGERLSSTSH